jgi:hypothetical protein
LYWQLRERNRAVTLRPVQPRSVIAVVSLLPTTAFSASREAQYESGISASVAQNAYRQAPVVTEEGHGTLDGRARVADARSQRVIFEGIV